jgi:tetratricopeptide (TPR) repeat protein
VLAGGGALLAAVLAAIVWWQVSAGRDDAAYAAAVARAEASGATTPVAIAALEDYLAERPGGRHTLEAGDRIKALDAAEFAAAEAKAKAAGKDYGKAIEAYKGYLAALPNGRSADEARKRAEKDLPAAWDDHAFAESEAQAKAAGDSVLAAQAAYQRYLSAFPNGCHARKAKAAQERADDEEFEKAKAAAQAACARKNYEQAIAAYQEYLKACPQGKHVAAAKETWRALECKAEEIREALSKMSYSAADDGNGVATITIQYAPDGPCIVRFRIAEGSKDHGTTVYGHSISVSYDGFCRVRTFSVSGFQPGEEVGRINGIARVRSVTWDGHAIREEKKK